MIRREQRPWKPVGQIAPKRNVLIQQNRNNAALIPSGTPHEQINIHNLPFYTPLPPFPRPQYPDLDAMINDHCGMDFSQGTCVKIAASKVSLPGSQVNVIIIRSCAESRAYTFGVQPTGRKQKQKKKRKFELSCRLVSWALQTSPIIAWSILSGLA